MCSACIAGKRSSILRWSRGPGPKRKIAFSWNASNSTELRLGARLPLIYQVESASSAAKGKDTSLISVLNHLISLIGCESNFTYCYGLNYFLFARLLGLFVDF